MTPTTGLDLDHCEHKLERDDDQRWVCTKCGRVIVAGRQ